ncbi:uncharacterized protein [Panulirus ornatus]|uniref:uncharacterized protein n=1 Tax=Panulirus ornatus TaxID=150431 RepID=UPI003A8C4DD5
MMKSLALLVCLVVYVSGDAGGESATHGAEAKLLATYLTSTITSLSIVPTVRPYTCYTVDTAVAVSCKRHRRNTEKPPVTANTPDNSPITTIVSSLVEDDDSVVATDHEASTGDEKLVFTVWTTAVTTLTTTSTSYNREITISVSAACTYSDFAGPYC